MGNATWAWQMLHSAALLLRRRQTSGSIYRAFNVRLNDSLISSRSVHVLPVAGSHDSACLQFGSEIYFASSLSLLSRVINNNNNFSYKIVKRNNYYTS